MVILETASADFDVLFDGDGSNHNEPSRSGS
jgi:hypothetical protein